MLRGGTRSWSIVSIAVIGMALFLVSARPVFAADAPTVTAVSPGSGPQSGGTELAITGTGFASGAQVKVGGVAATNIRVVSGTLIRADTPAGSPGFVPVTVTNSDGQSGTISNAFQYSNPQPTVSAVSPNSGPTTGGTAITIVGAGFVTGATVRIGGTGATGVVVLNSTTITAITPAHAADVSNVRVTNPDGLFGRLVDSFTFVSASAPKVTTVTPASGPTSGGTDVVIRGSAFVAGATVTVGGTPATNVNFISSTEIRARTPAHSSGSVSVAVRNPDGQTGTLSSGFNYLIGPAVTQVSPASGPISGATNVTITGTGFVSGATVSFGGTAATNVQVVSATKITARTPARSSSGPVAVSVINPGGLSGNLSNGFTYTTSLSISSVNPTSGPTGGGTAVLISGSGFVANMQATFGGVASPSVAFVSPSQVIATTPPRSAGTVDVVLTAPGGAKATRTAAFTYQGLSIASLSPTTGTTAGGTAVTIKGGGFARGAIVLFGGEIAPGFEFVSQSEIRVKTPARSAGRVDVLIVNPSGATGVLSEGYRYVVSTPTILRVAPNSGPTTGNTAVTIEGSGFDAGARVEFGGSASANVTVVTSTLIVAVTPAHAPGAVTVTVLNRDGSLGTGEAAFTYEGVVGVLSGTIAPRGVSLLSFSGGSSDQLVGAAASQCSVNRLSFFVASGGRFIGFLPGAPPNVNAEWNGRYPNGLPSLALLVVCR